ncbi:pyruvate/phosphate dikinase [Vibrio phage vB_VpS_PG28]|nr:pyruvate/phosphate dikinase [Vibrio phage vB_VpS_PG28]
MEKLIYTFGKKTADGDGSMTELLGGKGAKLAEMSKLGIPVPEGLTIPTTHCVEYLNQTPEDQTTYVEWLVDHAVLPHLQLIATHLQNPMLVSVRSGARVSMAGMMDTVLNVGITEDNFSYWKQQMGNRAAYDCLRRFKMMYADVVLGLDLTEVHQFITDLKNAHNLEHDSELSAKSWSSVIDHVDNLADNNGYYIPTDLRSQLIGCVSAVFDSWNTPRAILYREIHGIPNDWGTAVNIQRMVFGNLNNDSGSGVLFTSNPSTGEYLKYDVVGEYLHNAQGEDVVSGIRTPLTIDKAMIDGLLPCELVDELVKVSKQLENHFNDMQDIEFTVEKKKLYILQTRDAKRTPEAAVTFATTMLMLGNWDKYRVCSKLKPSDIFHACKPKLLNSPEASLTGIAAGGGIVKGKPCRTLEEVKNTVGTGANAIYVAKETEPDDLEAMHLSVGILTKTGGLTSHAAVVARGMNTTCVVGCSELNITEVCDHPEIAIDGSTGNVYLCSVNISEPDEGIIETFCTVAGLAQDTGNSLDITTMGVAEIMTKLVEVLFEHEQVILNYRINEVDVWQGMLGKAAVPNTLLRVVGALETKKDKYMGKVILAVDSQLVSSMIEHHGISKEWFMRNPETVDDLMTMKHALLDADSLLKIFGTQKAADHVLNLFEQSGTQVAVCYTPPLPYQVVACQFLGGN